MPFLRSFSIRRSAKHFFFFFLTIERLESPVQHGHSFRYVKYTSSFRSYTMSTIKKKHVLKKDLCVVSLKSCGVSAIQHIQDIFISGSYLFVNLVTGTNIDCLNVDSHSQLGLVSWTKWTLTEVYTDRIDDCRGVASGLDFTKNTCQCVWNS